MRITSKSEIQNPFQAKSGELIYELIGRLPELGGSVQHSFVHVVIPPDKSSQAHYHKISEETYYILKGIGSLEIDGKEVKLQPGQTCLIMPGEVHKILNIGLVDLEFLTVSAPAWTPDDSYFIGESL